MTDVALNPAQAAKARNREQAQARLKKRYRAEARFRFYGRAAIVLALAFLVVLLGRIGLQGYSTFVDYRIEVPVQVDADRVDMADLAGSNFNLMAADSVLAMLGETDDAYGEASSEMMEILSSELGYLVLDRLREDPSLVGQTITVEAPMKANASLYYKGQIERATEAGARPLSDRQLDWLDELKARGLVKGGFNWTFLSSSDSTEPEQAGVLGAVVGSAMMLLVTALLAAPIGVLAATYLEEFAPKNRWTDLIEVNINNLAAVPSIIYGLLGLAVFINWLAVPRSSPLLGGLVLALMSLPTIIIATRSALKAVPPSIREAALAVGASRTQTVFHHVLPLAMPGMLTGTILSLAHALGETAPLLMIGMVSFVPGVPETFTSAATVLPVQIFIWENASERAFHERTAAAIIVLLVFMVIMNLAAVLLRRRFERRW
ncbi:phosphate ABC transporter permease PstA [Phenylobacterium sp.]|uniref:phosphate ABC transporter permease PstA n=1 Tax=Phenylobacterium sp. TaxID=1871053 RepID=UPI0019C86A8B|nr:phosphate ABC transporter permease PstA [Phenylobacterium sp.]MBC7165764.1 phosphate ABC transporter permease PstA [Phenylobacterium sp.]